MMNAVLVYGSSGTTIDNALQLLGLFILFCFILVATYYTSKFVGKSKLGQLKNQNFEVIETMKVAPNKFLQLVRMGNKYVVISINKEDIRFITELDSDKVDLPDDEQTAHITFSEILAKMNRKGKDN